MSADDIINEKKREAVAELNGYREQRRKEREAREAAALSVDEEIAREIRARRADEEKRATVRAQLDRVLERREAALEAEQARDRASKEAGNPHLRVIDPPARRVAKLLRKHLGDQFDVLAGEIGGVDWKSLKNEIARIPIDEAAEAKHAAEQAMAARLAEQASTLPEPADEAEAEILRRHGFPIERRQAELDAGAL